MQWRERRDQGRQPRKRGREEAPGRGRGTEPCQHAEPVLWHDGVGKMGLRHRHGAAGGCRIGDASQGEACQDQTGRQEAPGCGFCRGGEHDLADSDPGGGKQQHSKAADPITELAEEW